MTKNVFAVFWAENYCGIHSIVLLHCDEFDLMERNCAKKYLLDTSIKESCVLL